MKRLLCSLALIGMLTGAALADEDNYTVYALGDRWFQVMLSEPVALPAFDAAGQPVWSVQVRLGLDDVPGGLDSGAPAPLVIQVAGVAAPGDQKKAHLSTSIVRFWPVYGVMKPYVTLVLGDTRAEPLPGLYRLGVVVRGRE